jgi:hypothetical protein
MNMERDDNEVGRMDHVLNPWITQHNATIKGENKMRKWNKQVWSELD